MKRVIVPAALAELHDVAAFYTASANLELGLAYSGRTSRRIRHGRDRVDHPNGRGLSATGDCLAEVSLMFNVLDTVVLTRDIPDSGLRRGDLGAIVEVYGANAFEAEFVAAPGRTQALVTLTGNDIRHVGDEDLVSVRPLERTAG